MQSPWALAVSMLCWVGTGLAWASKCATEGEYARKDGASLFVSAGIELPNGSVVARLRLQALGTLAPDGAPRYGNLEGELQLSRDRCDGVLVSEEHQCKLLIVFTKSTATVQEMGSCFTGSGVTGDGVYALQPGRKIRGSNNISNSGRLP